MSHAVDIDYRALTALRDRLASFNSTGRTEACSAVIDNLTMRFIRGAKQKTPSDSGTLRRGWSTSNCEKTSTSVMITNPVEYAEYVEYGHTQEVGRYVPAIGKRLKEPWVKGRFMATRTEEELRPKAPLIARKIIEAKLKEVIG